MKRNWTRWIAISLLLAAVLDVAEGVVCKGGKTGDTWMVKIKTNAYMNRLKESFASDWENYWE